MVFDGVGVKDARAAAATDVIVGVADADGRGCEDCNGVRGVGVGSLDVEAGSGVDIVGGERIVVVAFGGVLAEASTGEGSFGRAG